MGRTISLMGKGGVGKTTIAAILLKQAARRGLRALGVDADAQRSLTFLTLGDAEASLYQRLAEDGRLLRGGGMTRQRYDQALAQSRTRVAAGFDLLTMGRSVGEGCYCAANAAVKKLVFGEGDDQPLASRYDLVVVDCEAGPEKIARRMLGAGSTAFIVASPDQHGMSIHVAEDIAQVIMEELPQVRIQRLLNRVPENYDRAALPRPWQDALRLPDGEAELQAYIPRLFDKLILGVQVEPEW